MAKEPQKLQETEYGEILRQAVALLPWGHILLLMRSVADDDNRALFYATECVSKGWPRDMLVTAVQMQMYEHVVLSNPANNFEKTLPENQVHWHYFMCDKRFC